VTATPRPPSGPGTDGAAPSPASAGKSTAQSSGLVSLLVADIDGVADEGRCVAEMSLGL